MSRNKHDDTFDLDELLENLESIQSPNPIKSNQFTKSQSTSSNYANTTSFPVSSPEGPSSYYPRPPNNKSPSLNNPKAKFARESPVNVPSTNGTMNKKYNSDDENLDQLLEMIDDVHKSDPSYNNSYNFPKKSNNSSQPPSQIFYPSSEKSLKSHSESFYFDHKPKHIHSDDAHLGLSNSWDEFENNFVGNNKMSQGYSHSHQPSKDYSSSTNDNSNNTSKQRCSRVVLGGSEASRGARVSAFSKVVCDNLLCSSCNFKVLSFFNKEWSSSTDYLFLRNNMPNVNKLSMNLIDRRGSVAYCCQCSQASVQDERVLIYGSTTDPKWICSGHNC